MPLNQTATSTNKAPPPPVGAELWLRSGSKGKAVTTLQLRLEALHYSPGRADGDFGSKTLEAVKAFQRARGLIVDGVVGPQTAGALGLDLFALAHAGPVSHSPASPASGGKSPVQASSLYKISARTLVEKYASDWSTDEEGLAEALYARGKDVGVVTAAFKLLEEDYWSDSDDVALHYVERVRGRGGAAREMLTREAGLRELLIHLLSSGVTFPEESSAIQFLRQLAGSPSKGGASGSSSAPGPSTAAGVEAMVQAALSQKGKGYVFGAEVKASDTQAKAFDCSELVEWSVSRAGGSIPDGSQAQRAWCRKHGTQLSVAEAIKTRGALLFTDSHVAISLGDGMTIEAANKKKGVCSLSATGRGWTDAGLVPGLAGKSAVGSTPPKTTPKPVTPAQGKPSAPVADGSSGDVINGHVIYPNEVRAQGTLAWRNNNPGNIRNGRFTDSHGAFKGKSNRGFAIFPDHATGFAALVALLKTDSYTPLSVTDAMHRYAPPEDDNDPVAYAQSVSKMTGLDVRKKLGTLTGAELTKFASAIQKVEGWKAGVVYARNDPRLAQAGVKISSGKASGAVSTASGVGAVTKPTTKPATKPATSQTAATQVKAPSSAHGDALKKLGQSARKRMRRKNEGQCARGVCEMLGEAGFTYGGARPYVASGIINKVYEYASGKWIDASTKGYYVGSHSSLDSKTHAVKKGSEGSVKSATASSAAKFMRHTLKMFKFAECTSLLPGHGSRGTPPAESVKALRALPEGTVVVFGPAISRSVQKESGSYVVGGAGHAGHVGVLLHEGGEVLVVADGLLSAGGKYTVELCLSNYAWAVGFVPTAAPMKLAQKDRPSQSL